jgi:hypothetical protein
MQFRVMWKNGCEGIARVFSYTADLDYVTFEMKPTVAAGGPTRLSVNVWNFEVGQACPP